MSKTRSVLLIQKIVAVVLYLLLSPGRAQALGRGETGAAFLKVAPGARPAAMGEAFSAVGDDAHAVYYNPAGLGLLGRIEATGMHDSHVQGIRYEFAALAVPLADRRDPFMRPTARGTLALAIYNLSVSGIERRGTTETDAPEGTFGASDFAYAVAYGRSVSSSVALGASLKLVDQSLDSSRASAFALDAGGLWTRGGLRLAGGARNLGSKAGFRGSSEPLPLLWYGGAAYTIGGRGLLAADLRLPNDNAMGWSLGAEYRQPFDGGITGWLRGGYNSSNREAGGLDGLSLGGGVGTGALRFDFAWVPYGDLGDAFRYSLLVRF